MPGAHYLPLILLPFTGAPPQANAFSSTTWGHEPANPEDVSSLSLDKPATLHTAGVASPLRRLTESPAVSVFTVESIEGESVYLFGVVPEGCRLDINGTVIDHMATRAAGAACLVKRDGEETYVEQEVTVLDFGGDVYVDPANGDSDASVADRLRRCFNVTGHEGARLAGLLGITMSMHPLDCGDTPSPTASPTRPTASPTQHRVNLRVAKELKPVVGILVTLRLSLELLARIIQFRAARIRRIQRVNPEVPPLAVHIA